MKFKEQLSNTEIIFKKNEKIFKNIKEEISKKESKLNDRLL